MRFMEQIVGRIIGHFRHTCKPNAVESRWIEIHSKGNTMPLFIELSSRCDCGEVLVGYFTPEQLGYNPENNSKRIELAAA